MRDLFDGLPYGDEIKEIRFETDAPRTPDGKRFDADASRERKDAMLEQVGDNAGEWIDRFVAMVRRLPPGWVGLAEEFQRIMNLDRPHHPNAWGAATSKAVRMGLLARTGKWKPMRKVKSHARLTPEYRRT